MWETQLDIQSQLRYFTQVFKQENAIEATFSSKPLS